MITQDDVVLVCWSAARKIGEPVELHSAFKIPLITSGADSLLGKATICLTLPKAEACPMAWRRPPRPPCNWLWVTRCRPIGAAIFTADFKNFHPGGKLGASLSHALVMHQGDTCL